MLPIQQQSASNRRHPCILPAAAHTPAPPSPGKAPATSTRDHACGLSNPGAAPRSQSSRRGSPSGPSTAAAARAYSPPRRGGRTGTRSRGSRRR
eukprot:412127-Prymnesium_polylepis.1